jgi:hypothetical protein
MKPRSITVTTLLALAAAAAAQQTHCGPELGRTWTPIHAAPGEPGRAGGIWATGHDYKVSFHDGFAFTPYLGDTVRENVTLRWYTKSVTAAGSAVADVAAAPATWHDAYRFEYRWTNVTEAYDVRPDGVEQTFVFHRRPSVPGDLVVQGRLVSNLRLPAAGIAAVHGPLALCDAEERSVIEYGAAFAVDARGETLPLTTVVDRQGNVTLRVPGGFVAQAAFPLTIDPIVRRTLRTEASATGLLQTEICRDDRANQLLIAYARKASATDSDLFIELFDDEFNPVAIAFTDVNSNWSNPNTSIAFVGGPDRFVTVVERKFGSGLSNLRVNVRDSGSTALDNSLLFLGAPAGESHSHPDAGGIASGQTGDNAFVVFQQLPAGGSKHEVLGFVVNAATRTLGAPTVMAGFGHGGVIDRRFPAINQESAGLNDGWLVAYQEQAQNANDDIDVLYVRVAAAGNLASTIRVQSAFSSADAHKMGPKVGGRNGKYMVAFAIDESAGRPQSPVQPIGTAMVFESVRWAVENAAGLGVGELRRHVRSAPQWVAESVAFDSGLRTFWSAVYRNVLTGDCSISRHGFDAGEVDKQFLAEPGLGEVGFGGSVCFDDDARAFKATVVRNTGALSELVGATLSYTAVPPVTFGASCGGRIDTSGTPLAGSDNFEFALAQATPSAPALLVIGFGRSALPLDFIGMPGCVLNVDLNGSITVPLSTSTGGSAALEVRFPSNPVPLTGHLVAQFVFFAPGQNQFGALATAGVDVDVRR